MFKVVAEKIIIFIKNGHIYRKKGFKIYGCSWSMMFLVIDMYVVFW
jgi:hypothetical protein